MIIGYDDNNNESNEMIIKLITTMMTIRKKKIKWEIHMATTAISPHSYDNIPFKEDRISYF